MIKKLVAATASLLTACSTVNNVDPLFYSKTKTIQWKKVNNVDAYCRSRVPNPKPYLTYHACADWRDPNKCVIVTGMTDNFEHLGHELKHCFEGAFHP
jgi:hypothetical protein